MSFHKIHPFWLDHGVEPCSSPCIYLWGLHLKDVCAEFVLVGRGYLYCIQRLYFLACCSVMSKSCWIKAWMSLNFSSLTITYLEHVVMTTTRSKPLKQQRNTIFALKKGEKGFPLKMKCFWINGVYSDFTKFYLWKYSLHSCQKVLAQSKVGVTQRNTAQIYGVFANVRKSLNLQYL